jgi:hypothetical protein
MNQSKSSTEVRHGNRVALNRGFLPWKKMVIESGKAIGRHV